MIKQFLVLLVLTSWVAAKNKPLQVTEYTDRALGLKGWKVGHLPKATAHKFGPYPWCEMVPYLVKDSSGTIHLSLRITAIVAQPSPDVAPVAKLPDEILLRADQATLKVGYPREYSTFGALRKDFVVEDEAFIERFAESRELWLIAYTTYGNKERNDMLVPDAWKQAVALLLDKKKALAPASPEH